MRHRGVLGYGGPRYRSGEIVTNTRTLESRDAASTVSTISLRMISVHAFRCGRREPKSCMPTSHLLALRAPEVQM